MSELPTIKGYCGSCNFLRQEWHLNWKRHSGNVQEYVELDTYCGLADLFKRLDGYCDAWEAQT